MPFHLFCRLKTLLAPLLPMIKFDENGPSLEVVIYPRRKPRFETGDYLVFNNPLNHPATPHVKPSFELDIFKRL